MRDADERVPRRADARRVARPESPRRKRRRTTAGACLDQTGSTPKRCGQHPPSPVPAGPVVMRTHPSTQSRSGGVLARMSVAGRSRTTTMAQSVQRLSAVAAGSLHAVPPAASRWMLLHLDDLADSSADTHVARQLSTVSSVHVDTVTVRAWLSPLRTYLPQPLRALSAGGMAAVASGSGPGAGERCPSSARLAKYVLAAPSWPPAASTVTRLARDSSATLSSVTAWLWRATVIWRVLSSSQPVAAR